MFSALSLLHRGSSTNTRRVSVSRSHTDFICDKEREKVGVGEERDGTSTSPSPPLLCPPSTSFQSPKADLQWEGLGITNAPEEIFLEQQQATPWDLEPGSPQAWEVLILLCPGATTSWEGEGFRCTAV